VLLSVSILEEVGPLGPKCLLLSYFRVGDHPEVYPSGIEADCPSSVSSSILPP
jgi:hypothetical protein